VLANKKAESRRPFSEDSLRAFVEEKTALKASNEQLKAEKRLLRDEAEELRAMLEYLRGQVEGKKGLIAEPRSPNLSAPPA
jgi:hypothetical protein